MNAAAKTIGSKLETKSGPKEKRFLEALRALFVGVVFWGPVE